MAIYRLLLRVPPILSHVLDISDSETPHKLIIALRNKNARKTRRLGIRQEIIAPASIGMYARKTAWEFCSRFPGLRDQRSFIFSGIAGGDSSSESISSSFTSPQPEFLLLILP